MNKIHYLLVISALTSLLVIGPNIVLIKSHALTVDNDNEDKNKIADDNKNGLDDYNILDATTSSLLQETLGSKEDKGQQGPSGPPARTLEVIQRFDDTTHVGPGQQSTDVADCEAGELVIGGGYDIQPYNSPTRVYQSEASPSNTGWSISVFNPGPDDSQFRAFAECASLVPK